MLAVVEVEVLEMQTVSEPSSETLAVVREVVERNCDGEAITALSAEKVVYTLGGSGLTETTIERALTELVRRDELVETREGFRPSESRD